MRKQEVIEHLEAIESVRNYIKNMGRAVPSKSTTLAIKEYDKAAVIKWIKEIDEYIKEFKAIDKLLPAESWSFMVMMGMSSIRELKKWRLCAKKVMAAIQKRPKCIVICKVEVE